MAITPSQLLKCLSTDLSSQGLPSNEEEFWPGMDLSEAAAVSLRRAFLRKLRSGRTSDTDRKAQEKFLACNERARNWVPDVSKMDTKLEIILGTVRQYLDDFWHRHGLPLIDTDHCVLQESAVGPGVGVGARGESFYSKLFSSPMTLTDPCLYFSYRTYIWNFPEWSIADDIRSAHYGDTVVVEGSRLSFVPKNDEISRCICVEPILNSFYQLGLGRILERRLEERFGISLSRQPFINRALARLGSITDSLATLDLSSASDSISTSMLEYLLPKRFMHFLLRYRSPRVLVPGLGWVDLGMVSTMGNGYTFPLQTILFSSIVLACMAFRGIRGVRGPGFDRYPVKPDCRFHPGAGSLWSVFGDDIICPSACAEDVVRTLQFLGFSVNEDKSFVKGPFRESCGSDFFMGSNIRGVYVKTLDTPEARYSVINLLARFSTRTGISLQTTLSLLLNSVRDWRVPPWEDFSAGIHVPSTLTKNLHRDANGSWQYLARKPVARFVRFREDDVVVPSGCKTLTYNPSGLLVSVLQRSVRSMSFAVRDNSTRYRSKRLVAPSWEPASNVQFESNDYGLDWGQWKTVLESLYESR